MRGRSMSPETGVASGGGGDIVRSGEDERGCGDGEGEEERASRSSSEGISDKVTDGTSDVGEVISVVEEAGATSARGAGE